MSGSTSFRRRRLAILLVGLMASRTAEGATYHVAQTDGRASDTNSGTADSPWKTISRAVRQLAPGDTVVIHEGIYREWVAPLRSGTPGNPIVFEGVDRENVVLSGADRVTGWTRVDGVDPVYRHAPWTARFPIGTRKDGRPLDHHPADDRHRLVGRAEQVIVNGALLRQVLARAAMTAGTFFVDLDEKALYVWLRDNGDPAARRLEAATRSRVFGSDPWRRKGQADHIQLRNVTIRYAANHAQHGALWVDGDGWRIEHVTVEWTNGTGARISGRNLRVRDLMARNNGQLGVGGNPTSSLLEELKLYDNNRKGFDAGWEAGGMKLALARDTVVSRVEAAGNDGPGIWFDIDCRDCVVRQCYCHDNTGHGIFVEISGGFLVTNNLCVNNGTKPHWGNAGICIAESEHCVVEHNTCVANPNGISIREQGPRTVSGRSGEVSYWTRNLVCQFNICAFNSEYQFGLWSDNIYFGPHPSGAERGEKYLDPAENDYRIDRNLYFARDGQRLVLWGCPWRKGHRVYADLPGFTRAHGHDSLTLVADPKFADRRNRDYRLRPDSPALHLGVEGVSPR